MKCKNCNTNDAMVYSKYSSGEFCSKKCARSFSTKEKRQEINEKVRKSLLGRPAWHNRGFKKGYDSRRHIFSDEDRIKSKYVVKDGRRYYRKKSKEEMIQDVFLISFNKLGKNRKRIRILEEQKNSCVICKTTEWQGNYIKLELDHVDGNRQNNKRENLRMVCPNCHSFTKNYRGRNIKGNSRTGIVSDAEFRIALKETDCIRQALKRLGIAPYGGNYQRARKLLSEMAS